MNNRAGTLIIVAGALAAAAATFDSRAADQSAFFEQQREMSDGPQYPVVPSPARTKPATPHQIAEDDWLTAERSRGSFTFKPTPFPVPPVVADAPVAPQTRYQAAENDWLTRERDRTDGNDAPAVFVPPRNNTSVAGR